MIKFYFLFLLVFSTLITCFSHKTKSQKSNFERDTSRYAIIKFQKSDNWLFKNSKPTTINRKEVELIEKILKKAVESYNKEVKKNSFAIRPLAVYRKQFVPVINRKGEKEVWVNCLCDDDDDGWKKGIIMVDDGGNCYFNLKINLTKKTFSQIMINGYA